MKLPRFTIRDLFWLVLAVAIGCSRTKEVSKMDEHWPFDQEPNVAAITTRQVVAGSPILVVVHYSDDDSWAFMHGGEFRTEDGQVVSMKTIVRLDPSITRIADLPPGWTATRETTNEEWSRKKG